MRWWISCCLIVRSESVVVRERASVMRERTRSELGSFLGDSLEEIGDERGEDEHGLVGDTSIGVNLFENLTMRWTISRSSQHRPGARTNLVNVSRISFLSRLSLLGLFLSISGRGLLDSLLGGGRSLSSGSFGGGSFSSGGSGFLQRIVSNSLAG